MKTYKTAIIYHIIMLSILLFGVILFVHFINQIIYAMHIMGETTNIIDNQ
jgi:hypothetical protein